MCEPWHKAGACVRSRGAGAPPPAEMRKLCPHSCGDCPGVVGRVSRVPSEARCRRDNLTAAVPSGRLTPLFKRLLSDFPQYTPAALSTDPYIVQLHDFLSADEMAAFQRVCKPHFERSLAGDQLNPVRTSFQVRARASAGLGRARGMVTTTKVPAAGGRQPPRRDTKPARGPPLLRTPHMASTCHVIPTDE